MKEGIREKYMNKPSEIIRRIIKTKIEENKYTDRNLGMSIEAQLSFEAILEYLDSQKPRI